MYSFDLTAATDRLPLLLQAGVVHLIGMSVKGVQAWISIIVEEPFDHEGRAVYYSTGQGIGLYSS
jgi:hypothetical protein